MYLTIELKRQQKAVREKEERDRLYEDSSKVWQSWILPNWSTAYITADLTNSSIRDPRTRALWWNGLPSARRGVIWYFNVISLTLGNVVSVMAWRSLRIPTREHYLGFVMLNVQFASLHLTMKQIVSRLFSVESKGMLRPSFET
jgi:hypothetical protein